MSVLIAAKIIMACTILEIRTTDNTTWTDADEANIPALRQRCSDPRQPCLRIVQKTCQADFFGNMQCYYQHLCGDKTGPQVENK